MKKKFNNSLKSKSLLIIIIAFCGLMIALSFLTDMTSGVLRATVGYVITPMQDGLNSIGKWFSDKGVYFQDSNTLVEENNRLQSEVDSLTSQNVQLLADKEELDRLREIYDLDKKFDDYDKVGARIIAKDTSGNWFNVFTINKGSNDGIQVNNNVIVGSGLVGIVTEVSPTWSIVRSIIDDNSNVSGTVTSTSDNCVIAGDLRLMDEGTINLLMLTDTDDKVTVGDKVVTSDVSNRFLPGILIGYINELDMDSNNLTKSGTITPIVDFKHLHEVIVIKAVKEVEEAQKSLDSGIEPDTEMVLETDTEAATDTETE